jgi:DNA methylase
VSAPASVVKRAEERTLDRLAANANLLKVPVTDAAIWNEDNITGMPERLAPGSVDLVVTSIPFGALFMYSGKTEDIGNNFDFGTSGPNDMRASNFGLHMRFHIEQLVKVMAPGAVCGVHVQQLLTTKVQHGFAGRRDFRGAVIDLYSAAGLDWTSEFVVGKNPQRAAQAQSIHSLLFVTGIRDSRIWAPYVNDYVLLFRKPGEGRPVRALYDADRNPEGWVTREEWIRDASGLWVDIRETDVLGGWKAAGDEDDEKHVCPLQLEVIRRLIKLYSNPGDLVLDPFMGIGSTAVVAVELGRQAVGFELKESYHAEAVKYVRAAREKRLNPDIELPMLTAIEEAAA